LDTNLERAVTATLILPRSAAAASHDPCAEIGGLAFAAGAKVVDSLEQRLSVPYVRTGFGRGKVQEIKERLEASDSKLLIVDFDLSPSQGRNLEKDLCVRVVDRTELILDIFATRARTRQSILQVALAQSEYMKTRLQRMWTHLERLEGAIGTRGPGETQLETDRRLVDKKITDLKRRLKVIERRSEHRAVSRLDPNTISLVGYTNAGKSTLLSALTGADAWVADQLFATLDTQVRYWTLKDKRVLMLADTVGFVRDLPHHLVASFHATLEETLHADLLLHVCDASHPDLALQIKSVEEVLKALQCDNRPTLLVMNKVDQISSEERMMLRAEYPDAAFLSAHSGDGLDTLDAVLSQRLDDWSLCLNVRVPASAGKLLANLQHVSKVEAPRYDGELWCARLTLPPRHWAVLQPILEAEGGEWSVVSKPVSY